MAVRDIQITVRKAGIHIPPNVATRDAYEALSADDKFGLPVTPKELTELPKEHIFLPFSDVPAASYCSHLKACSKRCMKCTSGTCYILLVEDEHDLIRYAATRGQDFKKAWPRQWFGIGHGESFRHDLIINGELRQDKHEYFKCVEKEDFGAFPPAGYDLCACRTFLDCGYCECSDALRRERLDPEKKAWLAKDEAERADERRKEWEQIAKERLVNEEAKKKVSGK
jgi:hypothetical protein